MFKRAKEQTKRERESISRDKRNSEEISILKAGRGVTLIIHW